MLSLASGVRVRPRMAWARVWLSIARRHLLLSLLEAFDLISRTDLGFTAPRHLGRLIFDILERSSMISVAFGTAGLKGYHAMLCLRPILSVSWRGVFKQTKGGNGPRCRCTLGLRRGISYRSGLQPIFLLVYAVLYYWFTFQSQSQQRITLHVFVFCHSYRRRLSLSPSP